MNSTIGAWVFLIVAVCIMVGILSRNKSSSGDPMLCTNCHTKGSPQIKTKGSFFIELIAWVCFLIPGLIYSIWRLTSRHKACPSCGAPDMIPLHSPRAKQILAGK